jgi:hypothetical protein
MNVDAITVAIGSLAVSAVSLAVAATNAWLTVWRRGTVRMAQPPTVYFGPDGARELHPKVFLRCFLYATAMRTWCIESMFARLKRGDSAQAFPVWVCGGAGDGLSRGAGLAIGPDGVALHHHFLLPRDGTTYRFLPGTYVLELFAVIVGIAEPVQLRKLELHVTDAQATELGGDTRRGLYFDWSPDTGRFHGHIDNAKPPDPSPLFFALQDGSPPDRKPELELD